MARKALGRGISALLGEEKVVESTRDFLEIDIESIAPNDNQPRETFPETELDELAQSIRVNGVVQPVIVRPRNGSYQLVAGERRWRAAQMAELRKIPAIIREIDDDKMLEIALIENIQRQELNPVEESRAYKKLMGDFGLTQKELAKRVGKTRTFIANYLRLLSLPKSILKHVSQGALSVGHAKAILSLDSKPQQKTLANRILLKGLSVREAEAAAKRLQVKASNKSVSNNHSKEDPNIRKAESKLRRRLGTQVRILPAKAGTSGKIEIEYYGAKDLDRLYNLLLGKEL